MATMAASPRKDAPTFEQTWNESDAALLDPAALPIARLPRAWDRKQEVKTAGNGKKKEIWRRYGTRSRTSDATSSQDPEGDARARPVKRQQRMSPKAIERSAASRFGKTRAFKATRWDRRKSVLPRKKAVGVGITGGPDDSVEEEEEEEEQDTTITDFAGDGILETSVDNAGAQWQESALLPDGESRRATFTFAVEEDAHVSTCEAVEDNPTPVVDTHSIPVESGDQDATITRLFQFSDQAPVEEMMTTEPLSYPELPSMPDSQSEAEAALEMDQDHDVEVAMEQNDDEPCTAAGEDASLEADDSAEQIIPEACELQSLGVADIVYPALPEDSNIEESVDCTDDLLKDDYSTVPSHQEAEDEDESEELELDDHDSSAAEDFTEASMQLNIQRDMQIDAPSPSGNNTTVPETNVAETPEEITGQESSSPSLSPAEENTMDDITSGLTLGPAVPSSREPTPRKLRSPSPPPRTESGTEDVTMTFAFDDDTALLKNFLSRAAASKANKAENITRRESLQNRRDSDVVRHALASPRKALEDKDPNSPSKYDNETTLDLSQNLTLSMESVAPLSPSKAQAGAGIGDVDDSKAERTSRRSSRARKSRLPAPSSVPTGPPKIAVKRDGGDPVVLKKTDAQELSLLTRSNTRKNKQGSVAVNVRLLKLSIEARTTENSTPDSTDNAIQVPGKKYVRWDSQLAYFQEDTEAIANALADAESLATPDELSTAPPAAKPTKLKVPKTDKNATPKVRKVRNLGSANGTPGKGLLAPASLLPDNMLADKDELKEKPRLPKPKISRVKKMSVASTDTASVPAAAESKLPVLEIAPVGIDTAKTSSTKERKSRLATPRKVKLPQLSSTALGDGKENQGKGIAAATVKKSIPLPTAVVPPTVELPAVATGLPRRRARKL